MPNNQLLFTELLEVVRTLRGDNGCPWDQKQSTSSLLQYLHEEFQEIITAIEKEDWTNLCEELGDFLYLIIMLAEISNDRQRFGVEDVMASIRDKLIRRHPHVFAGAPKLDEDGLRLQWQSIKLQEKRRKKHLTENDPEQTP